MKLNFTLSKLKNNYGQDLNKYSSKWWASKQKANEPARLHILHPLFYSKHKICVNKEPIHQKLTI